jgi:hypothetical protein
VLWVEAGVRLPRPREEELDGGVGREGFDRVDVLAGEVEDDAAGDEDGQAWCAGDQLGEDRSSCPHVLGVVEDEQQLAGCQSRRECLEWVSGRLDPERARDRDGQERGIPEGREVDEGGAVREQAGLVTRDLEGEACLPGTARAREDNQPDLVASEQVS